MPYTVNPSSGELEFKSGTGGGGGVTTITPDSGTPVTATDVAILGKKYYDIPVVSTESDGDNIYISNNVFVTPYVVDANIIPGLPVAPFQTIQSAIDALFANEGGSTTHTILIKQGTYIEDIVIPAGPLFNIVGLNTNGSLSGTSAFDVIILGSITIDDGAYCSWANITLYSAVPNGITINNAAMITMDNCQLLQGANSSILVNSTSSVNYYFTNSRLGLIKGGTTSSLYTLTIQNCIMGVVTLLNQATLKAYDCNINQVVANDNSIVHLYNCVCEANIGVPMIFGTTTGSCFVSNLFSRENDSASLTHLFDFPGNLYIGGMQNLNTNVAIQLSDIASTQTKVISMPMLKGNITTSVVVTADYAAINTDEFIWVNQSGPVTISLSNLCCNDQEIIVKDQSLNASTNNITVVVSGGGLIDGSASLVMNMNGQSETFKKYGSNYFRI